MSDSYKWLYEKIDEQKERIAELKAQNKSCNKLIDSLNNRIAELEADHKEVNAAFHKQGWKDCQAANNKRLRAIIERVRGVRNHVQTEGNMAGSATAGVYLAIFRRLEEALGDKV